VLEAPRLLELLLNFFFIINVISFLIEMG